MNLKFTVLGVGSKLRQLVRSLSEWAWRDELDNRFTALEVAEWLQAYPSRYRMLTLSEWVAKKRKETKQQGE